MAWAAAIFMASLMRPGPDVQGPPEDAGERQAVVHLVGEIRPARGHHQGPGRFGGLGVDFRVGVGQGEDDGVGGHGSHHVLGKHVGPGQPEEDLGAPQGIVQGALLPVRVGDGRQLFLDGGSCPCRRPL